MEKISTLIHHLTHEELLSLFEGLQMQLTELKESFTLKSPTEYLTRNEVAQLLKCDISTVHNWTKKGKLVPYGMGNRIYYKRAEIESYLSPMNGSNLL